MKTNLNILVAALALAGCGGAGFASGGEGGDAGPGGAGSVSGDAGATGGAGGSVTGVTGGTGGVTGGTGGQAASGGTVASSGGSGAGTGGQGTGGVQAGSGGTGGVQVGAGGIAGSGGAPAVCKPPTLTPADLPQQVVWESYSSRYAMIQGDMCLSCQHSPCATCAVTWWPVTQSADGLTLTAQAAVKCGGVDVSLVACGSDPSASSCTTWPGANLSTTLVFSLQPKGDGTGFTATYQTNSGTTGSTYDFVGSCAAEAYRGAVQAVNPMWALFFALRDTVQATKLPCGG
jgi:hypothetical protein